MIPDKPLPYGDEFSSTDEYVEAILHFARYEDMFQKLAGGCHLLDFFTWDKSLFEFTLPEDWQPYILSLEPMAFVDVLLREDIDALPEDTKPPPTLAKYIKDVRRLLLDRKYEPERNIPVLKRPVSLGMNPKKLHEVANFADYVDHLSTAISDRYEKEITHFVDFGSGQNYLGRTLALPPYNKHIVAVEGRQHNVDVSRNLDVQAGLATKQKLHRNKKMWQHQIDMARPEEELSDRAKLRASKAKNQVVDLEADLQSRLTMVPEYIREPGKGTVSYVISRLENGDLSDVIPKIRAEVLPEEEEKELRMMAISIHSCGNLSHYGIRSLVMNPDIHAVAIVGCCYNLLTEKLGPPTYKFPYVRPSLQALNGRVFDESSKHDPQGFPLSQRLSKYDEDGIRFNITARMMACQAPDNWTEAESHHFFTRNLYRATLQRILLDRGVIKKINFRKAAAEQSTTDADKKADGNDERSAEEEDEKQKKKKEEEDPLSPFDTSTDPLILGSMPKRCYTSFNNYVRGAIEKLSTTREWNKYDNIVKAKMGDITDEEIERYEKQYMRRGREVAAIWSLMSFSSTVIESLIVTDRWLFLQEHKDVVRDSWVETVFDYKKSPRNMVVVGIKK